MKKIYGLNLIKDKKLLSQENINLLEDLQGKIDIMIIWNKDKEGKEEVKVEYTNIFKTSKFNSIEQDFVKIVKDPILKKNLDNLIKEKFFIKSYIS